MFAGILDHKRDLGLLPLSHQDDWGVLMSWWAASAAAEGRSSRLG
jgi:hypothetical protein